MFRPLARRIVSSQAVLTARRRVAAPVEVGGPARPAALAAASFVATGALTVAQCEEVDDAHMPRVRAHKVASNDLAEVRQVVRSISARTGGQVDAWVDRATAAFTSSASPDGTLGQDEVCKALQKLSLLQDQGLLWELGPLVFRLLDTEKTGRVRLKDFLLGQATLFAAAKAGTGEYLRDCCWRALDLENSGLVTKQELAVTLNLMLHLGAVDEEDLRKIKARAGASLVTGRGRLFIVQEQAVVYYMDMYDPQDSGYITRDAFANNSRLQENFQRLLSNDKIMPMFLTHELPTPTKIKI